ncbi:DmsC/YnfH family molybdoenzyme membrane anchor subunit [Persicirhabdus sediminis]|uniref:Dimethyl sulfoxide reductase anchor subunit n=1 Tax=Persicirhabdus sediminis TaxID=454144 RepID=A0A8J7SIS2_9BACT|nr:DmsC/YnfH family molybdoenzyme membrane anchor subunit [Persicirhabdus sediminis]MBK1790829.1 dimethyl sulfoxide reductase anchor subunit [Persicirhabdus sediminis]
MSYSAEEPTNLIDDLLKEQQELTAIERFSQLHDRDALPAQEPYYKALMPGREPSAGEQYSFEVNLDACTGCKACVTACHNLNGLDQGEAWRDVGVLFGGTTIEPKVQTVTSACHHCADPGCMDGCPVLAYEKDEKTGIVRHLDDQCIGCQYCILKCPYEVPKYNKRLGIVRKCDMCIDRLAEGEAPACVQACPTEAIAIRIVKTDDMRERAKDPDHQMIAGAYNSIYTKPTTSFRSSQPLPTNMQAGDAHDITPEHTHGPLVSMLTLTQISIGMMAAAMIAGSYWLVVISLIIGGIGMASSVFHLGSPLGAWRSFLGLRKSWLSREIVVLGGWFPLAILYTAILTDSHFQLDLIPYQWLSWLPVPLDLLVGLATTATGLLGIFCSVMVYADTHREFWKLHRSGGRFFGSAAVSFFITLAVAGVPYMQLLAILTLASKLLFEAMSLIPAAQDKNISAKRSALIQLQPLARVLNCRLLLAATALLFLALPLSLFTGCLIVGLLIASELLERVLFFKSVVPLKMPGNISTQ